MWTTRRIDTFLNQQLTVKCLPAISETATLRDALESATFFATSMGRIGADFSPLLPHYFVPRLIAIVTSHWSDGLNALQDTLKVCRDAGIASPLYNSREVISPIGNHTEEQADVNGVNTKTPSPPRQLLSMPPLARLVNAFLIGLNELRRCLLASSFTQLRCHYNDTFITKAESILVENERAVLKPGFLTKGEEAGKLRTVAAELKTEFENCVKPYLRNALEVAFGAFENVLVEEPPTTENGKEDSEIPKMNNEDLMGAKVVTNDSQKEEADIQNDEEQVEDEDFNIGNQEEEIIEENV